MKHMIIDLQIQFEKAKNELLASLNFIWKDRGLTLSQWRQVEAFAEEWGVDAIDELKKKEPEVSRLALEAGRYEFALKTDDLHFYRHGRALLFLGNSREAQQWIENNRHLDPIIHALLEMQHRRMKGEAEAALKIWLDIEAAIEGSSVLAVDDRAEAHLQVASVFHSLGQFDKSLRHNSTAYELFEVAGQKGKMAVAAFNAAVAAHALFMKNELRTWMWYAESLLAEYQLHALQQSFELFQIENSLFEKKFEQVIQKGSLYLAKTSLSTIQRIVADQAMAQALMELGHCLEAQVHLAFARQNIQIHSLGQFDAIQTALELDFETLTFKKISKSGRPHLLEHTSHERAEILSHLAQVRMCLHLGSQEDAEKIWHQLQSRFSKAKLQRYVTEDLELLDIPNFNEPSSIPRALDFQIMTLICDKKWGQLENFVQKSSTLPPSPWTHSLIELAQALVALQATQNPTVLEKAERALKIADRYGLEKIYMIALGVLALIDHRRQEQWITYLNQVSMEQRNWAKFFFEFHLGRELLNSKTLITATGEKLIPADSTPPCDLLINEATGEVNFKGELMSLGGQGVLFQFLVQVALSQQKGLNKEQIIEKVWGYRYDPLTHDPMIYTNVRRLRELVPIELHLSHYRLSPKINWALVRDQHAGPATLNERQNLLLHAFSSGRKILRRSEAVEILGVSERTALRELTELVEKGVLVRRGEKRGAFYELSTSGGPL